MYIYNFRCLHKDEQQYLSSSKGKINFIEIFTTFAKYDCLLIIIITSENYEIIDLEDNYSVSIIELIT